MYPSLFKHAKNLSVAQFFSQPLLRKGIPLTPENINKFLSNPKLSSSITYRGVGEAEAKQANLYGHIRRQGSWENVAAHTGGSAQGVSTSMFSTVARLFSITSGFGAINTIDLELMEAIPFHVLQKLCPRLTKEIYEQTNADGDRIYTGAVCEILRVATTETRMECERAPVVSVPTVCCLSSQPTIVGASFFQEPIINGQYMAPDIVLSNEMVFKLFCDYLVLFEKYKNKLNGLGHFTRPEWDELVEARAQLRYHYEIEKYGYLKIIPPKEMTPEAIKDYFASFPAPKEFEHITVVQDQDAPRFGKS